MAHRGPTNVSLEDYINNYAYSVNEMRAVRPLPMLVPTVPFPDPFQDQRNMPYGQIDYWPCSMSKPETMRAMKARTTHFYPRRRDWLHDWAEKMYRIGEFGAKQEQPKSK